VFVRPCLVERKDRRQRRFGERDEEEEKLNEDDEDYIRKRCMIPGIMR